MEDLWSFNEEVVARAIANTSIPTISGVGHETDFTISDFTADVRAATPTAAAELACQDASQIKQKLISLTQQLNQQIMLRLNQRAQKLDYLAQRLISPSRKLDAQTEQIKQLQNRLNHAIQHSLQKHQQYFTQLKTSVEQLNPKAVLARGLCDCF